MQQDAWIFERTNEIYWTAIFIALLALLVWRYLFQKAISSTDLYTNSSLQHVAICTFEVESLEQNISTVTGHIILSNAIHGSNCCKDEMYGDVNYDCKHTTFAAQIISFD